MTSNQLTPDFSFICLTIGSGGSGKTAVAFILSHLLLQSDPKRHVLLYKTPETLVPDICESLKAHGLEAWCPRFKRIEHLREVDINAVLIIDEGVLLANAKEALLKELVDFEQDLSFSRHKRIICLMNSVDDGVLLGYRKKAHITIYKQLTKGFVDACRSDKFVRQYRYELTKLEVREGIIYSTYKYFNNKVGRLKFDLSQYCPWYNDKISRNMENTTFSAQFNKFTGAEKLVDVFARKAMEVFGEDLIKKPRMKSILLGWMETKFPEQYFDLKRCINNIYDKAAYLIYMQDKDDDDVPDGSHPATGADTTVAAQPAVPVQPAQPSPAVQQPEPAALAPGPEPVVEDPANPWKIRPLLLREKFTYNIADILRDYATQEEVNVFNKQLAMSNMDKVGKELGIPRSTVQSICRRVGGFIANTVGEEYELVVEKVLKIKYQAPGTQIIHGGKKKADFIVLLPGCEVAMVENKVPYPSTGKAFVYSIKCYHSLRLKTKIPVEEELAPELKYCRRVQAIASSKGTKVDLALVSIFFNTTNGRLQEERIDYITPQSIEIEEGAIDGNLLQAPRAL